MNRVLHVFTLMLFLFFSATIAFGQNLMNDVVNSNLDGLKAKVALLSPTFKEAPYLDVYFSQTKNYSEEMTDYLIDNGADINAVDADGLGPLYYAIAFDHREAVDKLLALKVNPNTKWTVTEATMQHFVPSFWPAYSSNIATENVITKANKKAFYYVTPLFAAQRFGEQTMTRLLLDQGAEPLVIMINTLDAASLGQKKLKYITKTIFDIVVEQVSTGIQENRLQWLDPSHFACDSMIWKAVLALPQANRPKVDPALQKSILADLVLNNLGAFKAELIKTGDNTVALLPYAAVALNWDALNLILKYNGLDVNQPCIERPLGPGDGLTPRKMTLVVWCIEHDFPELLAILHDHGLDLDHYSFTDDRDSEVSTSLLALAATNSAREVVRFLIDQKVDVNSGVPLKECFGSSVIRDQLVGAGADINATFTLNDRTTAVDLLFEAASKNDLDGVRYYLGKGLDPNRSRGASPLAMAVVNGNPEIVGLLLSANGSVDIVIKNGAPYRVREIEDPFGVTLLQLATKLMDGNMDQQVRDRYETVIELLTHAGEGA